MVENKAIKLSKMLFIAYTIFLLLFLGLWLISTETHYIPFLLLVLGLALPFIGYFLTFFLKKMVDERDPRSHFFIVLNTVVLVLTVLTLTVSALAFYSDAVQTDLGEEHNEQVDAFVIAGDVPACIDYLVGNKLTTVPEAQTTCYLRVAIATQNNVLCENIPTKEEKAVCLAAFE